MSQKGIWVEVRVLPRPEILDAQGRAIAQTLAQDDSSVQSCRVGKCIRLCIEAEDAKTAEEKARHAAKTVLCNSLIETFEVQVLP